MARRMNHSPRTIEPDEGGWNRKDGAAWKFVGCGTTLSGAENNCRDVSYDITAKSVDVCADDFLQEIAKNAVGRFVYSRPTGVDSISLAALQEKIVDFMKSTIEAHSNRVLPGAIKRYEKEFENTLETTQSHLARSESIGRFALILNLQLIGAIQDRLPQNHPLKGM